MKRGQVPLLFGQPPSHQAAEIFSAGKKHIQTVFRENVGAISSRLRLPDQFPQGATGGFYGCVGTELSLPAVEKLFRVCLDLGIPMSEWGGEQCTVIYLLGAAGAFRLAPDKYLNFEPNLEDKIDSAHVVHFLGFCRFYKNLYTKYASQLVRALPSTNTTAAV